MSTAPIPLEHVGTYDKRTHVAVPLADLLKLQQLVNEARENLEEIKAEVKARRIM